MSGLKRYSDPRAPWHTHLYRAAVAWFRPGEKPWHAHVYRAWRSLRKDSRYCPPPGHWRGRLPGPGGLPADGSRTAESLRRYHAAREQSGV